MFCLSKADVSKPSLFLFSAQHIGPNFMTPSRGDKLQSCRFSTEGTTPPTQTQQTWMPFLCEKKINPHPVPALRAKFPYGVFSPVDTWLLLIHLLLTSSAYTVKIPTYRKFASDQTEGGKQNPKFRRSNAIQD